MATQLATWTKYNENVCCTCEYWNGERELNFIPGQKLYAIMAQCVPPGKCAARNNITTLYCDLRTTCKTYKRWHMLP